MVEEKEDHSGMVGITATVRNEDSDAMMSNENTVSYVIICAALKYYSTPIT
jgi:hypothetical protein